MKPRATTAVALYLALAGCVCGGALAANLMKPARSPLQARAALAPDSAAHRGGTAGGRPASGGRTAALAGTAAPASAPAPFTASVATLPQSGSVREPSIAIDGLGEIFVTAPSGLQHPSSASASPVWRSSDAGATWSGPTSTETGGQTAAGAGGAASDIAIGPDGAVYVTTSWNGNTAMAVSTDHGSNFTELPVGHITPVDERPWLSYDPLTSALYMAWDGAGALHVGKALLGAQASGQSVPGAGPQGQLVFEQDVPAVVDHTDRGCDICPPGTVAVDPSGAVHVAFSGPNGVGVASSADGVSGWGQSFVPGTAGADAGHDYQVLRGDGLGNLYLVWTQAGSSGGTSVYLSYMRQGTGAWHAPIAVSASGDGLFGTLAVVSPGVVDVAYYGTGYAGDPNSAPDATGWNLDMAKVENLFGTPSITTADMLPGMHHGAIFTGGLNPASPTAVPDSRLGNFFGIAVDSAGLAAIVTVVDDGSGSKVQFVHESPVPAPTPGPQFVLPSPSAGVAAKGAFRYPPAPAAANAAAVAAPSPDSAAAQDVTGAAAPAVDTRTAGHASGPKYPDGVGISSPAMADSGGGGHGLPLWAYVLLGAGGTAGRFVFKRGRG